jgi:hypothetical protein
LVFGDVQLNPVALDHVLKAGVYATTLNPILSYNLNYPLDYPVAI